LARLFDKCICGLNKNIKEKNDVLYINTKKNQNEEEEF
jgi:hypothetical protein